MDNGGGESPGGGGLGVNGGKKLGGHHGSCGFRDGSFLQLNHHPYKLSDNRYCDERDLIFYNVSQKHLFKWTLWLEAPYPWSSHCFDGFGHCGSGDKTLLICHLISKDHVFKGLCVVKGGNPSY